MILDVPHLSLTMLPAWLNQWPQWSLTTIHMTQAACSVSTPLCPTMWESYLSKYPNCKLIEFFLQGLRKGFHIRFDYPSTLTLKPAKSNMESAHFHAEASDEYLQTEIFIGCFAGAFPLDAMPDGHASRFGVILKNHQPNKWQLIVNLSYSMSHSINDGISPPLCSLHYVTIDDAVHKIFNLGKGCLLEEIDNQSAFRLLLFHPADRHLLLLMKWNDKMYVDTCLPFIYVQLQNSLIFQLTYSNGLQELKVFATFSTIWMTF